MTKFLLIALLFCSAFSLFSNNECLPKISEEMKQISAIMDKDLSNQKIDAITNILNQLPTSIEACLGEKASDVYKQQLPANCIADLNKAAKLGLKMQNQKDNQLMFSKDLFFLQRLYQNKLKKQCPLLTNVTLNDIKDAATCMQSSYRFSLLVQTLVKDFNKHDKKAIVNDLDKIVTQLPNVLDICGKTQWANNVRKYLPINCVHAIEDLIVQLSVLEHHYTHLQWLVKNYKDVLAEIAMVKMHCPIFY